MNSVYLMRMRQFRVVPYVITSIPEQVTVLEVSISSDDDNHHFRAKQEII